MLNPNFDKCLLFGFCYSHYFPQSGISVFNSFVVPNVSPRANINLYFLTDFARQHHAPPSLSAWASSVMRSIKAKALVVVRNSKIRVTGKGHYILRLQPRVLVGSEAVNGFSAVFCIADFEPPFPHRQSMSSRSMSVLR